MLLGEVFCGHFAPAAELCLQAARQIVYSGVNHTAVMASLVLRGAIFFLEQDEARAGPPFQQLHSRGKANDAPADDTKVKDHVKQSVYL